MEKDIIDSLDNNITALIDKINMLKSIEVSDVLRQRIAEDLRWLQRSLKRPNFIEQLKKVLSVLFPLKGNMREVFEQIEQIDEYQKFELIKTLVFQVINTEAETKKHKNLERIMRTIHSHLITMSKHYNDVFFNKFYKKNLIDKFFKEEDLIRLLSRLGLTSGLEDTETNRIKFDPEIEELLISSGYFSKVDDKIQIQSKFTENCLFQLWLAWYAVNRNRIQDSRFITGFCSVFADIILGAILPSIPPDRISSKVKNSPYYDEDKMDIKPRVYSQKELVLDALFDLTKFVAYHFNGDGWANSVKKESSAQGAILSTAFREEIRGMPAVKQIPIYVQIREIMVQIKARAAGAPGTSPP